MSPSQLGLSLRHNVEEPMYRQIFDQIATRIRTGAFPDGYRLPPTRALAATLGAHRNTVVRAYRELEIAGVLDTQQGSGTFVGKERPEIDTLEQQRMLDQILTELLVRASSYGFTLEDILDGLGQRKEAST